MLISAENIVDLRRALHLGCLVIGFLLAVFIDQKVRFEGMFRTIFLYPLRDVLRRHRPGLAMDAQPGLGIQKLVRDLGLRELHLRLDRRTRTWRSTPSSSPALWHGSGLVMAMMLAGLRGIDEDLWKAARVDGIPTWRVYLLDRPADAAADDRHRRRCCSRSASCKLYDLVVAMTSGGPGIATEVPAKFVMDHLFERDNIGLGTAASTVMLVTVRRRAGALALRAALRAAPQRAGAA